jgi:hypothetical protein
VVVDPSTLAPEKLIKSLSAARSFSVHLLVHHVLYLVIYAGAKLCAYAVSNRGTGNEAA